jgi:PAS domain S-box-containing protein
MRFRHFTADSLTQRFALAAAMLATVALLLIAVFSWGVVTKQHAEALRVLQQKEADFHATTVSGNLRALASRMSEVAGSSILATGLVDSIGKETYLSPYLNGIRQINGVPIQILFADYEGKPIADNGKASFHPQQLAWLRDRIDSGKRDARIFPGPAGAELVVVELLRYSRTQSPEGAVLYKVALADLHPGPLTRIAWGEEPVGSAAAGRYPSLTVALDTPPIFRSLNLRVVEKLTASSAEGLVPQYGIIFVMALALAVAVFLLGSRLALALTRDLRHLETFSRGVVRDGFGAQRAQVEGSIEVSSLARSINHMLDRLYQQHAQLQYETEKLHQLANTIPQLAWMADPDGSAHWYNDRWYAYTGATPEQMLKGGWQQVLHPDLWPRVLQRWQEALAAGEPFQMTFSLRNAEGEYRPFFTSVAPFRDAQGAIVQWFGTNTDLSPLERAERAVRESEERLREGLVAARMVVWEWDIGSGKVTTSSNAGDVLGCSLEKIDDIWDVTHPDDMPALRDAMGRAITENSRFAQVVRMTHASHGDALWLDVRGKAIGDATGMPCAIRGISIDITERKRAEEALHAANKRKDEFLAMLAHELRNPLAPISMSAELLKLPHLDQARVRKTSEVIGRQVAHMTSLVDDLLDVSRVTRGLITLEREALPVNNLVENAIEQVRPLIEARNHRLTVEQDDGTARVMGDRTRLVQVVANILNNAAKYTAEGGDIVLRVQARERDVCISVQDNGIGIAPELLPHVFDLFTQAERSPDRAQGGLGLGLALVRTLTELHGGSVTVASDGAGKGSRFGIYLPRLDDATPSAVLPRTGAASPAPAAALHVMVVDDNMDAARTLAMLLEVAGHEVTVAYGPKHALELAAIRPPHVFILDIGLPEMDGYALTRTLKSRPENADAVFIALTGYGQQQDRDRSLAAGFDFHLVKPVENTGLIALLNSCAPRVAPA